LLDLSVADYERSFAINTRATWLLAKAGTPAARGGGKGSIVATASISGHETDAAPRGIQCKQGCSHHARPADGGRVGAGRHTVQYRVAGFDAHGDD